MALSLLELVARDNLARVVKAKVGNITFETPSILVVVDPSPRKQVVSIEEIRKLGVDIIMTSAFIAMKKVGRKNLKEHLGWDKILYTDSGTYQAYSQGVSVDPEESVRYQAEVGADIITPVDEFVLPDESKEEAMRKAMISVERWERARKIKEASAPVQGGLHLDVRQRVVEEYSKRGAKLLAIGGVVPLMVKYRYSELVDVVASVISKRPFDSLIHVFGAGHPTIIPILIAMGADLFDSAMYAIAARDDRYLTPFGTFQLQQIAQLKDFPCDCPVCSKYKPQELLRMEKRERERLLALHNLYVLVKLVKEARERIKYGTFTTWVISYARLHAKSFEALYRFWTKWRKLAIKGASVPRAGIPNVGELSELRPEWELVRRPEIIGFKEWRGKVKGGEILEELIYLYYGIREKVNATFDGKRFYVNGKPWAEWRETLYPLEGMREWLKRRKLWGKPYSWAFHKGKIVRVKVSEEEYKSMREEFKVFED